MPPRSRLAARPSVPSTKPPARPSIAWRRRACVSRSSTPVRDRTGCHEALSGRLSDLLDQVDQSLRDLMAFVPLWLGNIEKRRALMFQRLEQTGNDNPQSDGPEPVVVG